MAGVSICPTRSVVANWEPNLRRYRVTYKVVMSNEQDGPGTVLNYMAGQGYVVRNRTYVYHNDSDSSAVLVSIDAPRRGGGDKLKTVWLVDGNYEFDLQKQPNLLPVKVEPYYVDATEPIEAAYYWGAFNRINDQWVPKAFAPNKETYSTSRMYPIGNSSNVPIIPAPERDTSKPAYRVSWIKRTALDAASFIGTWNNAPFQLSAFTIIYNAPNIGPQIAPTIFKQFPAFTLRLRDVQQPTVNIYGQEWFNVTLEFVQDEYFLHELDRGLSARAKAGDPDGRGGTYSEGDFPEGSSGQREILDLDGQPVSDPVLLDGTGKPLRDQSTTTPAVYLRWNKGFLTDFTQLQIGDWT
jgi:hypothetical protein